MSDYIKREDAINTMYTFLKQAHDMDNNDDRLAEVLTIAKNVVHEIPPADVAPVRHGTWEISMKDYNLYDCSNCHKVTMFETWGGEVKPYGYCPNCGAKMDEGEDNED